MVEIEKNVFRVQRGVRWGTATSEGVLEISATFGRPWAPTY